MLLGVLSRPRVMILSLPSGRNFLRQGVLHLALALGFVQGVQAAHKDWIRPAKPGDPLVWGLKNGVVFGLPSEGGMGGPRGLIRIGYYSPKLKWAEQLVNFVAVEPVVKGDGSRFSRMAFSELEESQLDPGKHGKRLSLKEDASAYGGEIKKTRSRGKAVEQLIVPIDVERFAKNKAHVYVTASMFSDRPLEVQFQVNAYDDSPAIEELTLTATMGNFERLRILWLKDRAINSKSLYNGYSEDKFVERDSYALDQMLKTTAGDPIVLATSDEAQPSAQYSKAALPHWRYQRPRLTQYWRVPASEVEKDLRVRVNGRRVYWASHNPIPGGIAFENFEIRQSYRPGQAFIFGMTTQEPWAFKPAIPHLSKDRTLVTVRSTGGDSN